MTKISNWLLDIINSLNQQEKVILLQDFVFLCDNLESIFGMTEPWLLIIDNQILNDLKYRQSNEYNANHRKRYIRLIAVFMVFNFLVNYSDKRIGIVLTPCIFYEFNQRKIPDNSKSFNSSLDNCFSLLNEFGVKELFSFGLDNYKIARLNLKNICHDEKEILKLIQKLKRKKMNFELYQKFSGNTKNSKDSKIELFNPPFIIAFQLVAQQRINLKYFDRNIEI